MEQKIVIVPRQGLPRNFLLGVGIAFLTMLIVTGALLAASFMGAMRRGLVFSIPNDFFTTLLIMTVIMLFLIVLVAIVSANQELLWVHAPKNGEIRLEDWYYGTPVFTRRYPIKDVAGIRVWWQPTHSGSGKLVTNNPGWWMAALILWNGKSIHLHGERSGPEHPPVDWLERFQHACRVSGVELKQEPVGGKVPPAEHPTTSIINRLKR